MNYFIHYRDDSLSLKKALQLKDKLEIHGHHFDDENPEVIITIGGDGTMLHAIHNYIDKLQDVKFVGIHTGTLGFFTDYTSDELDRFIDDFDNDYHISCHPMIESRCYGADGQLRHQVFALNEARVENIIQTQTMRVSINNEFLEEFRGNGLCVSGQIGSTAYNRSIGGAIIDDTLLALQLTEISGIHHRHYRSLHSPLVLNPKAHITFESDSFEGAMLVYDHLNINLHHTKKISIFFSDKQVNFIRFKDNSYYSRLRSLF